MKLLREHEPVTTGRSCCPTLITGRSLLVGLFFFLVGLVGTPFPGCGRESQTPGWTPPTGNIHGTRFYPRPSSSTMRKLSLKLVWTSDFVPQNRVAMGYQGMQLLSTGIHAGRTCLAVLRGGIMVLDERGEQLFNQTADNLAFGLLTGQEYAEQSMVVVRRDQEVLMIDLKGSVKGRISVPNQAESMWVYDLDKDGFPEILLSERERVPPPPGSKRTDWEKRMVRCYDARSAQMKWEYLSSSLTYVLAIGDLNADGYPEIVCGTHSQENALTHGDMIDSNRVYLFVLDRDGNRKWMQSFIGRYGRVEACVADLDGDGSLEIIASIGNWQKDWGSVHVFRGSDGKLVSRYPADHDLDISITRLGVADLDGNGKKEIICTTEGRMAGVFVLDAQCRRTDWEYRISPHSMNIDFMSSRLVALNDVDGDGSVEIIVRTHLEKLVANDPRFMYSRWSEPELLVLGPDCTPRFRSTELVWFGDAIISDLIPGGPNEFIVLGDEVAVYSFAESQEE